MKAAIIGHAYHGTTSLFSPPRVSVNIIDDSDRDIKVTGGNIFDIEKYNMFQPPLTRQQRRKLERTKNK